MKNKKLIIELVLISVLLIALVIIIGLEFLLQH